MYIFWALTTVSFLKAWLIFLCSVFLILLTNKKKTEHILMDCIAVISQIQTYIKTPDNSESNMKKGRISVPEDVSNFANIIYQFLDHIMTSSWRRHLGQLESNWEQSHIRQQKALNASKAENQKNTGGRSHEPSQPPPPAWVQLNFNFVQSPRGYIHSRRTQTMCFWFSFKLPRAWELPKRVNSNSK